MLDNKKLVNSMKISGICKALSVLLSFIYVPVAMGYLGEERYGVWAVLLSVLSWIEYMDIGIGNGLRNRLTEQLGQKNFNEAKETVSSAYVLLSAIMLSVIAVFCIMSYFVDYQYLLNAYGILDNINLAMTISVFFVSISFVFSLCKSILFSMQKAQKVAELGVLNQLSVVTGIIIVSKILEADLVVVSIIYGVSNLLFTMLFSLYVFWKNPHLRPSFKFYRKEKALDTVSLGVRFLVIQIVALVLFSTDNLIITNLYGPKYVTYYSTVNKAFMIIATAYNAIVTPLWSAFTLAKAENNIAWIKNVVKKIRIYMIPIILIAILLATIFKPFSAIWLQRELDYPKGLIPLMALYIIIYIWCSGYSMVTNGLEMINISVFVAIIQGIVNIPLSLFLAKVVGLGVCGVLLGSIGAMLISAIVIPIKVTMYIQDWENREKNER